MWLDSGVSKEGTQGLREQEAEGSVTGCSLTEDPAWSHELTQSSSCMSWTIRCRTSSRVSLWAEAKVKEGLRCLDAV